jgi:membrane protein involved in colicin uptake
MSGIDGIDDKILKEQNELARTRDALTEFLNTRKLTGDAGLAKCQEDKMKAAEAAKTAMTEAANKAKTAKTEAANKAEAAKAEAEAAKAEAEAAKAEAEAAKVEAAKAEAEAKSKCETEKSDLEKEAKKADKKRASEILVLQNKLIIELARETKFLNSLMGKDETTEASVDDGFVSADSDSDSD